MKIAILLEGYLIILLATTACSVQYVNRCNQIEVPVFTGDCMTDLHVLVEQYVVPKESVLCK